MKSLGEIYLMVWNKILIFLVQILSKNYIISSTKLNNINFTPSLLHRAFRRITLTITNKRTYIKFHIKTLKITPTCFDPKIILKELSCSLLKSF